MQCVWTKSRLMDSQNLTTTVSFFFTDAQFFKRSRIFPGRYERWVKYLKLNSRIFRWYCIYTLFYIFVKAVYAHAICFVYWIFKSDSRENGS
jgi:hypothetical protein